MKQEPLAEPSSSAPAPPPRRPRPPLALNLLADHFPALHGLRALAIVSVLQVHVSLTLMLTGLMSAEDPLFKRSTNVWFGMDLFFVLSGFLIGTLLLPAEDATRRGGILRFYVRRAFRIIPLYYVVLTVLALAVPALPAQRPGLIYEYAYLTNYAPLKAPALMPWAWSLCVEEHFYLAVPLLAAVLARLSRPSLRIAALVALWLSGFAVRYAVFAARPVWTQNEMTFDIYTRTHTRFDVLVAGVLLAYVQRQYGAELRVALKQRRGLRLILGAVPMICCAALLGPLAQRHDLSTIFAWGTVTSVMYFSLVLLLINTESPLTRFLSSRWFLRFATLGYGVYLVHPPIIAYLVLPAEAFMLFGWQLPLGLVWVLGLALLLGLATPIAYGLHLAVEKPALWVRDKVAR